MGDLEGLEFATLGVKSRQEAVAMASKLEEKLANSPDSEKGEIAASLARIYSHLNEPGKAITVADVAKNHGHEQVYAYCAEIAGSNGYDSATAMFIERLRIDFPETAQSIEDKYRSNIDN